MPGEDQKTILFISPQPFFERRGSPIRVRYDVEALSELGYRVHLLTLPFGREVEIPGVTIIRVSNPLSLRGIPIGPSLGKGFSDLLLLWRALRLSSRFRYDFVHCIEEAGIIGVLLKRLRRCPCVFERHSEPAAHRRGPLRNLVLHLYAKVESYVARNASAVITGPSLLEQLRAIAPGQRLHVVLSLPSSLAEADPKRTAGIRRRLLRGPNDVLITYVGSFAVYQGIDLLFESMPAVVERHPEARFVVIGGSEREIAKKKDWLSSRRIGDAVIFVGEVEPEEIPDYLAASDILLSPRLAGRNSPTKVFDYLKAERAIVATSTQANRLVLDESTSLFAEPTPEAFSAAISKLVTDPESRRRLSQNGKRIIAERYNYEDFKRRLAACYAELR